MRDDGKAGVKSTGVILADYIPLIVMVFDIMFVALLAVAGILNGHSWIYFVLSVGAIAFQVSSQLRGVDINSPSSCWCEY